MEARANLLSKPPAETMHRYKHRLHVSTQLANREASATFYTLDVWTYGIAKRST